jgi:uncharacterized membrane protein
MKPQIAAVVLVLIPLLQAACETGPPREAAPPEAQPDPIVAPGTPTPRPGEMANEWDTPQMRQLWADVRARGVDFRAIGQEPGWTLEIWDGERMEFVGDYGERRVTVPAPPPETPDTEDYMAYRIRTDAHTVEVIIVPTECQDVMSGQPFPATVTVTVDGDEYRGCGRAIR